MNLSTEALAAPGVSPYLAPGAHLSVSHPCRMARQAASPKVPLMQAEHLRHSLHLPWIKKINSTVSHPPGVVPAASGS